MLGMARKQEAESGAMGWNSPIERSWGVGQQQVRLLGRLGIATVGDLMRHFPLRYDQEEAESAVGGLTVDAIGSARGVVAQTRWAPGFGSRGKPRFEAILAGEGGQLQLTWFHAGYLRDKLLPGITLRVQGKVGRYRSGLQMINPRWHVLKDAEAPAGQFRLRPVYPATEDLPSWMIERLIEHVLPVVAPTIEDPLPADLLAHHAMPSLADAYRMMHRPSDLQEAGAARRRLAFNELLLLQLGISLKRRYNQTQLAAPALKWSQAIDKHICARFPFELTAAQRRVVSEIAADLQRDQPMNRLLQGDVGSGKTVVALYALLMAAADRKQGALMAPTELLAEQHYASIGQMLSGSNVRIELLTGGKNAAGSADRKAQVKRIAEGEADLVIGTQALLTEAVQFADLAVVVVDEQHRFGVLQRAAFRQRGRAEQSKVQSRPAGTKSKVKQTHEKQTTAAAAETKQFSPHYLVMTATPIPRTLSLTIFGDLDASTIDELPPGRTPIRSRVVAPTKSDEVYRFVAGRVAKGEQAYVVVPVIDASGHESMAQLKNVRTHAHELEKRYFQGRRVAMIHGRLKSRTREGIMYRFRRGEIDVLVATTVIEVGVDVPTATVMVIEHAERFGLAQLHQLRGRIGRGSDGRTSVCVFITDPTTEDGKQRMKAIGACSNGFDIAERDLEIRGMGEFFGTRQHGLPPLRVANIPADMELLQLARRDAERIVQGDPVLTHPSHLLLRKALIRQHGGALGLIDVG